MRHKFVAPKNDGTWSEGGWGAAILAMNACRLGPQNGAKAADIKMNLLPDIQQTLEWLMKPAKARKESARPNKAN